ncbi:MAG: LamG domain-containing protein [Victivallales bacterium]|nr:LamG domain-containing protein [Victivallales bacterium]
MNKLFFLIAVTITTLSVQAQDSEKLPIIAYWSFDNDSGNTLIDSGPNKLNAVLKSKDDTQKILTAEGMKGKALFLEAKSKVKYVIDDKKNLLNITPPYTICAWVKKTAEKPKSMCIFSKKFDSHSTGYDFRISWNKLNSNVGNGSESFAVSSPYKSVKDNTWNHFAITNDGEKIILFINGETAQMKIVPEDISNVTPKANKAKAVIANYVGRPDAYNFVGLIDELYIIAKVLTNDELFQLAAP